MSQTFIHCPNSEKYVYEGLNLEWLDLETLQVGQQELTSLPAAKSMYGTRTI